MPATDVSATESTSSATAVTVTTPALAVEPAAMVSVAALDRVKSSAAALTSAAADTVIVTAALDLPESVAVTAARRSLAAAFGSSSMLVRDSASVTVGAASSSVRVRVASAGATTPLPPAAVAETVTDLSGESASSSAAVTVTAPALAVEPAAMVRVLAALSAKSPPAAPVPGAAATVRVTAALDLPESVAVTVETPPFSEIDAGASFSATVGSASSSTMVPVPTAAVPSVRCRADNGVTPTFTVSSGSWTPSPVTVTGTVLPVSPGAKVSRPPAGAT